jgi:hypothetical protein
MSDVTTKSPRGRWRGIAALTGFALLLAAAIGAGSAAASPHYSPSQGDWPGSYGHTGSPGWSGGPGTPPQQPVPGTGSSDPTQLAPPAIDVLTNTGNTAPGSIFIAPKPGVGTTTLSGQEGPEIIDNQGRPIWFQPINAPYSATDFRVQRTSSSTATTSRSPPSPPATA